MTDKWEKWEAVWSADNSHNNFQTSYLHRFPVPGGWLYSYSEYKQPPTMTFVPDPTVEVICPKK